ncbi:cell wall metabolism sensor histidine kinase WalK [Nocardioides sp. R-C-SC26]|uniref:sensor histidine kinase n=1 Tax=Nocardioides sp. R-C-SC26 TaxID=2870414 RepID=UPI001E30F9DA|nr:PAS domain-containing sensor histidine kinase [Nocardioides sp. R-C-SC26]
MSWDEVDPTARGGISDLLRAALDAVPDAVVIVDGAGVIVTANTQVREVFGYEPAELEGQSVEALVPARLRSTHPRRRGAYQHRPMGLLQLSATRRDGSEFPAEISLASIEGETGRHTVATVRDVTSRLELEAEADRMRDEFLATVTHELRTPLTSILGYAELLADEPGELAGEQAQAMLQAIERNARRELQLVSDLLTLAVANLAHLRLDLEAVDLGELVADVVREARPVALAAGVVLGACNPPRSPAQADRLRVRQVVENLVGNAVKFARSGDSVEVSLEPLTDSVVLRVADTGPGIAADDIDRVFDRLYRGQNAAADHRPGAGLGLALVRSIVDAHGGSVAIESRLGAGTVVTVQLPVHDQPAP